MDASYFEANNPTKNQYIAKYPGWKKFAVKYSDRKWPREDHVEFHAVPNDPTDPDSTATSMFADMKIRDLTDEEVTLLVEKNTQAYDILRGPFTVPGALPYMAVQEKEWFKYCHYVCVDFTPLGCHFMTPDLRGPVAVGDITYDFHMMGVPPANHKIVTISEHENMVDWILPSFELSSDI
jgi:hypothetical protein